MDKNVFTLPAPLSHYRAIVGSAHVIADAWKRFGVAVTLESGRLMHLQSFVIQDSAARFADKLNACTADP